MGAPAKQLATWEAAWEAELAGLAVEVIDGVVVEKALPTDEHGTGQIGVAYEVVGPFARKGGRGGPGGWWLRTEVDIELSAHNIVRPDISGWRRDSVPELPKTFPCRIAPDWVCEVLSPSTAARDRGPKADLYHAAGVSWYWVVDPANRVVEVLRRGEAVWEVAATSGGGFARLPPFDAVELFVGRFFGEDPPEE